MENIKIHPLDVRKRCSILLRATATVVWIVNKNKFLGVFRTTLSMWANAKISHRKQKQRNYFQRIQVTCDLSALGGVDLWGWTAAAGAFSLLPSGGAGLPLHPMAGRLSALLAVARSSFTAHCCKVASRGHTGLIITHRESQSRRFSEKD